MTNEIKITGNIRYRNSLLGKMILQVEFINKEYDTTYHIGKVEPEDPKETRGHWRDANIIDVQQLEKKD